MTNAERKNVSKNNVRITATLSSEQYEALVDLAGKKKVSAAWMIREAVDKLVEDMSGGRQLPFT